MSCRAGGGVISEPRRAIYHLETKYGRDRLLHGCWELVQDDIELPEGVVGTAWGVVYHLADEVFLEQLLSERTDDRFDRLIAYTCHRLKRALPDGIAPLTEEQLQKMFAEEEDLPTLADNIKDVFLALILLPGCLFDILREWWVERRKSSNVMKP
jgi:hypothetical protein